MKFILFCSVILLSLKAHSFALRDYDKKPRNLMHLQGVLKKYDKKDLIGNLREFVKETRPTRIVGSQGHHKTVNFVIDFINKRTNKAGELAVVDEFKPDIDQAIKLYKSDFEEYDKLVKAKKIKKTADYQRYQNFTKSRIAHLEKLRNQKGRNIIWEKKGKVNPDKVIVIGAHYDTIAYDKKTLNILPNVAQPGADNNASGVAISLGLIEVLSEMELKNTVRIVFFDFQELGFLGSWDYAKKLKVEMNDGLELYSYVNLLMLGHDSKLRDKEKKYGNMRLYYSLPSSSTYKKEREVVLDLTQRAKSTVSAIKFIPFSREFKNGDNTSFQNMGIPAITFTQNWESDLNDQKIHTSKDFVETLNFKTLYNSYLYIGQAVGSWALHLK